MGDNDMPFYLFQMTKTIFSVLSWSQPLFSLVFSLFWLIYKLKYLYFHFQTYLLWYLLLNKLYHYKVNSLSEIPNFCSNKNKKTNTYANWSANSYVVFSLLQVPPLNLTCTFLVKSFIEKQVKWNQYDYSHDNAIYFCRRA